jgi:transporter family protein
LVLLAALFGMLCWGIAPIFGKIGLGGADPLAALTVRTYISAGLITTWAIRSGVMNQVAGIQPKAVIFLGLEGLLAAFTGDLAYYFALKHGDVSFVTLIMSCSPVVSLVTAVLFLHERLSPARLFGSLLIVIGLVMVVK